jgi:hypothetical protein
LRRIYAAWLLMLNGRGGTSWWPGTRPCILSGCSKNCGPRCKALLRLRRPGPGARQPHPRALSAPAVGKLYSLLPARVRYCCKLLICNKCWFLGMLVALRNFILITSNL